MDTPEFKDAYASVLEAFVESPEEQYLAKAADLGREMVRAGVPPEEIAEIHKGAILHLAEELPDKKLLASVQRISTPLMEMLMAYGLALREQQDEPKRAEEEREELLHDRGERVKELQCMYGVTETIRTRNTVEEIFQDVAELIPPGWHYPEITRGKVIFDEKEYVSEPFAETEWKQSSDIIVNGESRGSIEVYYLDECPELDEGPFMKEERNLINGMAKNISEAIERKRAEEKLDKANRLYATLSQVNQAIVRERDKQKLFQEICNIAIEFGRFRLAWIGLVNEENKLVKPASFSGVGSDYLQDIIISLTNNITGKGPTGRSIREGKSVVFNDLENNPDFAPWREQALEKGYRSSGAFPIRLNNIVIGALNVYAVESHFFDEDEINLLEETVLDISFALEKFEEEENRKQAEEELQERRDENTKLAVIAKERGELQEWINTFDTFVGKFDPNGVGLIFNKAPILAGGVTIDDVVGQYFPDTKWWSHSEIERARIIDCFERAKAGLSSRIETTFRSADGTPVPIIFNCQPVMDDDGKVKYITAEGKTIIKEAQLRTELQEAKEALETRVRERTSELVEANKIINRSPAVAFLWKNEEGWPVEFVSENVEKLFGYSAPEFLERKISYSEIIHSNDLERVAGEVANYSKKEGLQTFAHEPYRIITKDGDIKWIDDISYIRRDSRGIITHYEGIVYDVTERKHAEAQLRLQHSALEAAANGIVITDHEGTILWVNEAFTRLTGYTKEEALGETPRLLKSGAQDPSFYEALWQTIRSGAVWRGVLINRRKDGCQYPEEMTITPIRAAGDAITHFIAIKQDITRRKQAEEEKRQLSLRLLQAEEAVRRRVAQDLHDEVGGLLTALGISLQMVSDQEEIQAELKEAKDLVGTLAGMIRQAALDLHPSLLDDLGLVPALRRFFSRYATQTTVEVDFLCEIPVSTRFARELETGTYRIIQEALTNVARYAGVGAVQVLLRRESANLVVHIIDDGRGFDLEAERAQKTSLGLSGMAERALLLGGSLTVETTPGAGTRVSAILPLA